MKIYYFQRRTQDTGYIPRMTPGKAIPVWNWENLSYQPRVRFES